MALDPLEILIIAVVVLVFFMWGPKKIPELARSIGLARKEFTNASSGNVSVDSLAAMAPTPAAVQTQRTTTAANESDTLIDTARRLGINTEGKTRDQVSNEIVQRATAPA